MTEELKNKSLTTGEVTVGNTEEEIIQRMESTIKFGDDLVKQGHTCVVYLETWPPMIDWCENKDKCTHGIVQYEIKNALHEQASEQQ